MTIAKHAKVASIAAFDSGNLLEVATSIRERYKDKQIIIAGDLSRRLFFLAFLYAGVSQT